MKSKKILVLIIIALIVILFANIMIIKSKKFSKIEKEKEIVTEINNTDDEEIENTEVMVFKDDIEKQEKVEEIPQEIDTVKDNIQEETNKNPIVTQEKKVESSKTIEQTKTTPITIPKKTVKKKIATPVVEAKTSEQPKEETKVEIKQQETTKCSDSKHGVGVGNSNKWFDSKQEAINYYQVIIKTWGDKWEKFEIDDETYQKNCPYGYEIWSCPLCEKWTINFYYN